MIRTLIPRTGKLDANTARAESKPSMDAMFVVETCPVTSLVMAMLRPWSIRNIDSVTRKLGSFVRTRIHPLRNPMARETASATAAPTHTFTEKYQANIDAVRPEVITATPADRSNSPPIISSTTPTAMMPMVELAYRIVAKAPPVRNGSAMLKKRTKTMIMPTSEPTSGRVMNLRSADLWVTRRDFSEPPFGAAGLRV